MSSEINTRLYEKMFEEQEKYRSWLLSQPPEEILNHTYEYTVREDILLSMEYNDLTDAQARALLGSPSPLGDIFSAFEKIETDHMDCIRDCIENRADDVIARAEAEFRAAPVYYNTAAYAREHGELDQYRLSYNANVACKEMLEKTINSNYSDNRLNTKDVFEQVSDKFSTERIKYVLAVTVRHKDWDGRLSNDNKAWAQLVPVAENKDAFGTDRNCYFVVDQAHTGLIDLFVTYARKEFAREKEAVEKKPSVLKKLKEAQTDIKPKAPVHPKETER